jgi:fatty-acyl-CoA synthase
MDVGMEESEMTEPNGGAAPAGAGPAVASGVGTLTAEVDRLAASRGSLAFLETRDGRPDERTLTHVELAESAARATIALQERGVRAGDRVCLLGSTSPELVISLFASWRAGAVPVVLPPVRKRRLDELARRLEVVGARVLVADPELSGLPETATRLVPFPELTASRSAGGPAARRESGDLALVQFTSGSTARPRAVTLTHANLLTHCRTVVEVVGVTRGHTWLSWLPLYHDMGIVSLLAITLAGASTVLMTPEQFVNRPGAWLDAAARHACFGSATPTFGLRLAAMDLRLNPRRLDLSSVRALVIGAEQVDLDTLGAFAAATGPSGLAPDALCPAYGLAEATLAVTMSRPDEPVRSYAVHRESIEPGQRVRVSEPVAGETRSLVSCGRPIPNTEVRIETAAGAPLPPWRVGEVVVRGPGVMAGYWSDGGAGGEVLGDDGRLHTGDLGFFAEDADLVVCGRIKDMIIIGGHNVYPEEYESAAGRVPGVRGGSVIAFSVPEIERMVVVAEISRGGDDPGDLAGRVMASLREDLAHAPEEVVIVRPGTVPRTTSGKLQRQLCCRQYVSGAMEPLAVATRQGG